jgi:hypothetical protein
MNWAGPLRAIGTDELRNVVGKLLLNFNCVKTAREYGVGFLSYVGRLGRHFSRASVSRAQLERVAQSEFHEAWRADLTSEQCEGAGAC